MKARQWKTKRQVIDHPDAQRGFDQAYQSLLRWTSTPTQPTVAESCQIPKAGSRCGSPYTPESLPEPQAQAQTIEQQLERLQGYSQEQGWVWPEEAIFLDEGYSGASLKRRGLDRLRDQVAQANFALVLMTAPDRLARKYVHQVLLIEELEKGGCQVAFADRPMSQDPHDQLLLQIRGVVAEYERNLIDPAYAPGALAEIPGGHLAPLEHPALWLRGGSGPSS